MYSASNPGTHGLGNVIAQSIDALRAEGANAIVIIAAGEVIGPGGTVQYWKEMRFEGHPNLVGGLCNFLGEYASQRSKMEAGDIVAIEMSELESGDE